MNYNIEKKKDSFEIKMTFTGGEWDDALNKAYKKGAGRFKVPGFRGGKVPRKVIENNYGETIFHEDGISELFLPAYNKVMSENDHINPIDYPSIDFNFIEEGIEIIAIIDILPEFKIGKYTGLEVQKAELKVAEKEVDNYLEQLRKSRARQVDAKDGHKIVNGDVATIDFVGSVDGVEFPGGRGENYELEIGSNSFIDTFESQLIGKRVGDVVNVNVTFPKQYHAEELAGKPALFVVTINKIMQKELPTLDDAFAKDVSEFETMAEFKADSKKRIEDKAKKEVEQENENRLIKKVVEQTKLELPEKMVERQLDHMLDMMASRLAQQGLSMEMYAQYTGTSIDTIRDQQRGEAENVIRTRLIIDEIVRKEKIEVTDKEIDAKIDELVAATGGKKSGFSTKERMDYLRQDIRFSKVVDFLTKNNKFV